MLYTGPAFSAAALGDGIVELKFDLAGESVNKLNQAALRDFARRPRRSRRTRSVKGVIVTSGKPVFIVGADITEFGGDVRGRRGGHREGRARREPHAVPRSRTCRSRPSSRSTASASAAASNSRSPRLPRDVHCRLGRLPRSEARHLPGLRRLRAHAARHRHRQRGRVDLLRRRQEARRGAQGRRRGRRGRARAAARRRDRDA